MQGPLTVSRTPQGHPVIVQAGASEQGQEIAAASADIVFVAQIDLDVARDYYASVKQRLAKYGRCADDLEIMPGLLPVVGRTEAEAHAKHQQLQDLIHPLVGLVHGPMGDLSAHPIDGPVPEPIGPAIAAGQMCCWSSLGGRI
jgi:N-acetyl-S-(2-succino)cysteine monooxygenase